MFVIAIVALELIDMNLLPTHKMNTLTLSSLDSVLNSI